MPTFLAPDNRHGTAPCSRIQAVEDAIREAWNGGYRQGYTGQPCSVPRRDYVEWGWWIDGYTCGRRDRWEERAN